MPPRSSYVEFLEEQFSSLGQITSRYMFGGYCLYCDGSVFALVAGNALYLKADDTNRDRFVERGLEPFRPYPDRDEVMSYYQAPAEIFEDPDARNDWVGSSIAAGRRGRKKPVGRKRHGR